eukprot:scaffold13929_cov79-Cyclotella_meneghiniana.AAC.12
MGAHAIGRGSANNSGHEGTWSANAATAMVFDKSYFKALGEEHWRPRNPNESNQDWTLDRTDSENPRMMLNTDLCLIYDIEARQNSCCANIGECRNDQLRSCPRLGRGEANDNSDFYEAFATAWQKSIELGWENQLSPLDHNSTDNYPLGNSHFVQQYQKHQWFTQFIRSYLDLARKSW